MSGDIVSALSRFGETLDDPNIENSAKLQVLRTLADVKLTLGELSNSGVGRSVRRLKREPGELGRKSRELVIKWKALLDEHMKRENIDAHSINTPPVHSSSFTSKHTEGGRKARKRTSHESPAPPLSSSSDVRRKGERESVTASIDASSGLSFEQAMGSVLPVKKSKKRRGEKQQTEKPGPSHSTFAQGILASLEVPVDRPDMHCNDPPVPRRSEPSSILTDPEEDGNLKFRSKKIMWVPRARRQTTAGIKGDHDASVNGFTGEDDQLYQPPRLVDICLTVLQRNLDFVDHVGQGPYDLFSPILRNASVENLKRIEKYNPQFHGLTDDIWKLHVHREFPESQGLTPRHKETWAGMFDRLSEERSRRLDLFIRKSATKLRAEEESHRKTQTTEVITPSSVQRRASRHNAHQHNKASSSSNRLAFTHRHSSSLSSSSSREPKMNFKPRNMSYPSGTPPASAFNGEGGSSNTNQGGGGMLGKLRKQFLKGR